ncbi:TetR/AcrR family transcriptional regulator [Nocardia sp. CA-107356]|uniref:TetR/AcrR family transcriptional regulator n=1 Tax=Nocardia sp. CA-107356 TaxID=3239972 RepID=UPI003D8EDED2
MTESGTAERLAAVAQTILLEEGAAAVTMRRVAAAVGVTPMATYRHFPNREALLRQVVDTMFAELGKTWGQRPAATFAQRVAGLLDDFLDFALGKPNLYQYLITDRRAGVRQFPQDFRDAASPAFSPVVAAVEQAMADGELREDDPLEVSLALTMPAVGMVQLYLGGRMAMGETDFRALCRRTMERALDGLRA